MKRHRLHRRYGRHGLYDKSVQYAVPLAGMTHEEIRPHSDGTATLYRFGRPIVTFLLGPTQRAKLQSGMGVLNITSEMIARAR
jgi:hypothetical protein